MSETGIPITGLPAAGTIAEDAVFPLSDGDTTYKATKATLRTQLGVDDAMATAESAASRATTAATALAVDDDETGVAPAGLADAMPHVDIRAHGAQPGADIAAAVAAAAAAAAGRPVVIPAGYWRLDTAVVFSADTHVRCDAGAVIDCTNLTTSATAFTWEGVEDVGAAVTDNITQYARQVTLDDATGFEVGDVVLFTSDQDFDTTRGGEYTYFQFNRIVDMSSDTLTLAKRMAYAWDNTTYPVTLTRIVPVSGSFHGGRFVGAGVGGEHCALEFRYCQGVRVGHVDVTDMTRAGVRLSRVYGGVVSHVLTRGVKDDPENYNGYAVIAASSSDVIVSSCIGENNRHSFEANNMSSNILFDSCIAIGDRTSGFSTHAGSDYVTFNNCLADSCGGGITSRGGHATLTNNVIRNCIEANTLDDDGTYFDAIRIGEDGDTDEPGLGLAMAGVGLRIINNRIEGPCRHVIHAITGLEDCDIIGNSSDTPGMKGGFRLIGGSTARRVRILDNRLYNGDPGGDEWGIVIPNGVQMLDVMVCRNIVHGMGGSRAAFGLSGNTSSPANERVTVTDNIAQSIAGNGYQMTGTYTDLRFERNAAFDVTGTEFFGNGLVMSSANQTRGVVVGNHSDSTADTGPRGSAAAPPSAGPHRLGDIVWNTTPAAEGTIGWVCVSAGTPGTWKAFGAIEA